MHRHRLITTVITFTVFTAVFTITQAATPSPSDSIYNPGQLKAVDSSLKVAVGEAAPDFSLPSLDGRIETLTRIFHEKQRWHQFNY